METYDRHARKNIHACKYIFKYVKNMYMNIKNV